MKVKAKKLLITGTLFLSAFAVWTLLIKTLDVQSVGVNGTDIGFAVLNTRFHWLTGVNMSLYTVTDWLGLVPLAACAFFGAVGFVQLVKRKSLSRVDSDIIVSGVYYVVVVLCYLFFEMIPINYRPVLINGAAEASYPSSTTLLVLCVMPSFAFLCNRRLKSKRIIRAINIFTLLFSALIVAGRLISGVHWLSDIVGAALLSAGLFLVYESAVIFTEKQEIGV
ncbi:MAG: phosphatase PAP2 family protein [Clostridia bacterium]|nr:phosphatase PAP2 family protein [Clostridia bacterium]